MKEVKAVIGKMELTEFIPQPLLVKGVIFVYKSINNKINEMKENARAEGYEAGLRKGNLEAAKRLSTLIEKSNTLKSAVFALGIYIANLDGTQSNEEIAAIKDVLGRPDSVLHPEIFQKEFNVILDKKPSFFEIKKHYLDNLDFENLKILNEFILIVISADGVQDDLESLFYNNEWKPYFDSRK